MYEKGEIANLAEIIYRLTDENIKELHDLPGYVQYEIMKKVAEAPYTEEQWTNFIVMGLCAEEHKVNYRRGVEAHRKYYNYDSLINIALRDNDNRWREEIEKHLPQLAVMSFAGPHRTIEWVFDRVNIKPEHAELANKLKSIDESVMPEDTKTRARLESIFPGLRGETEDSQ